MADPTKSPPLERPSIIAAHALIKEHIHYTPVLTNTTLDDLASQPQSASALANTPWAGQDPSKPTISFWFKCENFQKVGAFKARGAFHALKRLMTEEGWDASKGVVTHSSVSLGNRKPRPSPRLRSTHHERPRHDRHALHLHALQNSSHKGLRRARPLLGLHVRRARSRRRGRIAETGARLIPPYDHPDIMLGQGTLGIELQEQVEGLNKGKGLDAVVAPCGGGGMLSGVALSCEGTGIHVFGAEPSFEGADDCRRGLEAGKRIETVKTLTIADGLRTPVGAYPWTVIHDRKLVRQMFSVTEEQIKAALRLVLERMKIVVEPSAVVGIAAALYNEDFRRVIEADGGEKGWDLGVVVSGGNVSVEAL
ncbi:putative serine racemase, partial [Lachnellula suecica]